jgi:hypothetical protein
LLLRCRPRIDSAMASVVTGPSYLNTRHGRFIKVMNHCNIYISCCAVIEDSAMIPIGAIITTARISETVVDAAIKTDVGCPVAGVPDIDAILITPPWRRPKRADPWRHHPRPRNPVVSTRPRPVTRRPDVIVAWAGRLAVLGKRWWGFRRFDGLLISAAGRRGISFRVFRLRRSRRGSISLSCFARRGEITVSGVTGGFLCCLILRFVASRQAGKYKSDQQPGRR